MDKKSRAGPVSEKDMLFPPDLQKLPDIIKNIKYGSITMLIRNGQVIQIGKNEKMR
ncbi:MAG: YezD family protein [Eubacteriales bacterium]